MSGGEELLDATKAAQRRASDPSVSAFVAANAGAGKTHVLTARVARLLLAGALPSKILCITFTKAAAAEMSERLFKMLGEWALAEDAVLAAKLAELEGGERERKPEDFATARRLFARALETPGGLKIQTIHSFCENVLKRFPLEAGTAPGFSVIDDRETQGLASAAIARVVAAPELRPALARLQAQLDPDAIAAQLQNALVSRQKFNPALDLFDLSRRAIGADPARSAEVIRNALLAGLDRSDLERARDAFAAGGAACKGYASKQFETLLNSAEASERFEALREIALTQADSIRKNSPDIPAKNFDAWVGPYWNGVQNAVAIAASDIKAAAAYAATSALLEIRASALSEYERMKAARAGLDFEDLVERTRALLQSGAGHWVRYKLDEGVDHVLLDEAQDTSPAQWGVVESLIEELRAGIGARDATRTFFAVGDQKQSIYSFQGADASLFEEKRADIGKDLSAVGGYRDVPLNLSFRTSAPVLQFVDALFATKDAVEGVSPSFPLRHDVKRASEWGRVELWPLAPNAKPEEVRAWDAPLDQKNADNPARRLADAVAQDVKARLGAPSPTRGRPWSAGDFMILVQSRGPLFYEMIRSLTRSGVAVAGADKIALLEEAAVEDALSYARAALFDADDLSLAETLKCPFFGLDDASLFDLAYGREGSLRVALDRRRHERPEWARAADEISAAAQVGRSEGAFAFLSHILESGAPSGRRRLYRRLGAGAAEPLGELMRQALEYERGRPRSLEGFVLWASEHAGEIKRDLEQASSAARVMTVHGAKGLEADCVYLLDAHKGPNTRKLGPLFFTRDGAAPGAPVFSANTESDCAASANARATEKRRAYEEYRRLLYVAATRARDRLVICGHQSRRGGDPAQKADLEKTWHALAVDAFARLEKRRAVGHKAAPWLGEILSIEDRQSAPPEIRDAREPEDDIAPPAVLFSPAPRETAAAPLAPSDLHVDTAASRFDRAYSPVRPQSEQIRGRAIHRLFELLPDVPPPRRAAAADRLLESLAGATLADERARWREEVLAILADAKFAAVFASASRAEAPIAGVIDTPGGPRRFRGQIDRLAVEAGRVLVVDYKSNRPPPQRLDDLPAGYLAQLGAYRALLAGVYPNKRIETALLWTYEARLMEIPPDLADHAFARALS